MQKRIIKLVAVVVALSISTAALADDASKMVGDVGKGMQIGGTPSAISGSPIGTAIVAAGILVDILSGILGSKKVDMNDPKVRAAYEKLWNIQARMQVLFDNKASLKATSTTTPDQVKAAAVATCADLDKRVATGGTLQMSRERMKKLLMPDYFLPPDDTDVIQYKLQKNPVDNCVEDLTAAGQRLVDMEKKKASNS